MGLHLWLCLTLLAMQYCQELVNECHDSEKDYIPGETYIKGNCTQKCSCNEVRYVGHVEQCVPLFPSMPPKCLWGTITEFYQEDIDGSECSCRKCVPATISTVTPEISRNDGGSLTQSLPIPPAETTMATRKSAAKSMAISTTDTTTYGETTPSKPTIVTTKDTTADDEMITRIPMATAETTADAITSGFTSTRMPTISIVMTAAKRTTAGGGSSQPLVSMTTAETTADSGLIAATSMTIPTTDTRTDGEITAAKSTIVATSDTTADDDMNKSTATPMITMYSSTLYKPGPIDCDINNGSCEEVCIRGVNGNDSCSCRLGVLGNDGRSCNYTGVLYYLSKNYTVFIDTRNKMKQSLFLPSNGTVTAVTYDFQKRRLFYADVRSENSKIDVIFPGNRTRRDIYLAENQQILKLAYDSQLNALIYFTAEGNGTMLTGIDDTASGVQALNMLNSNDLPYGPLQITGIVLEFCGKFRNVFLSAKANDSFGLIIYLNAVKLEIKILAQLNGRADGLVNDLQQRKLYWINGIKIEEANYDGSCRRVIAAFYAQAPRYLMFYNNTFYWEGNRLYWRLNYEYSYIFQTNRIFGDTEWSHFTVNRIVDSGIVSEGRNDVCHRDGFNTCSPRVIRPQLTNNMVLFSANRTNSSVLRTGLNTDTAITLSEPVPMLSSRSSKFYVGNHGILYSFPIKNRYIAVYQTSMITTVQGDTYYRESRDFLEKSRVTSLIRKHKNDLQFTPTYLWIVTWDDVPEYSLNNKKNTFQFLIASNGSASYGIWLFKKLETSNAFLGYNFGSSNCRERFPYTNQQLLQMGVIVRLISHCSNSATTITPPFPNFTEAVTNSKRSTGKTRSVKLELINQCHDDEIEYLPGENYIKGNCTQNCSCSEVRYVGHVEKCVPLCPLRPDKCSPGTIPEFYQQNIYGSKCACRKWRCVKGPKFLSTPSVTIGDDGLSYIVGCKYVVEERQVDFAVFAYLVVNQTVKRKLNGSSKRLNENTFQLPQHLFIAPGEYQCLIEAKSLYNESIYSNTSAYIPIPEPRIVSKPYLDRPVKVATDFPVNMTCNVASHFLLHDADLFWLKNGIGKFKFRKIRNQADKDGLLQSTTIELSASSNDSYSYQGYYQCVVFARKFMKEEVKSSKLQVQFQDVSSNQVTFRIQEQWDQKYSDPATKEYVNLKEKLVEELTHALKTNTKLAEIAGKENIKVIVEKFSPGSILVDAKLYIINMDNEKRLQLCDIADGLLTDISSANITTRAITNFKIQNLDCCKPKNYGSNEYKGKYRFPKALAGSNNSQTCKYGRSSVSSSNAIVNCEPNMETGPTYGLLNVTSCPAKYQTTNDLEKLAKIKVCSSTISTGCEGIHEISEKLKNLSSKGENHIVEDIKVIVDVVEKIVTHVDLSNIEKTPKILDNLLAVVDNIMANTTQELLGSAQIQKNSATRLLEALDNFIENIAFIYDSMKEKPFNLSDLSIQLPNIAFNINRKVFTSDVFFIARNKDGNASVEIATSTSQSIITSETLAVIRVPQQTLLDTAETLFSYQFRKPSLFFTESQLQRLNGNKINSDQVVDSEVLSVSVLGRVIKDFTKHPIILSFKPLQTTNLEGISCQFWKPHLPTSIPGVIGSWSTEGCEVKKTQKYKGFITCECNHLTNFALLLDVSQTRYMSQALSTVTLIGCGISIAGLALTIITFLYLKKPRSKLPGKILILLCTSLMLLLIVFLIGIEKTSNTGSCQTVAALLHYFILTTFLWMGVEAANLYQMLVKIFQTRDQKGFLIRASIIAWGIPALIVAITMGAASKDYGDDKICMVHGYAFYIAVVIPVAAILFANTFTLTKVIYNLYQHGKKKARTLSGSAEKKNPIIDTALIISQARIAFSCNVLLGITWTFALLAVGKATMYFQWLFCIFNSLQGFFIFVFYTLRNQDVKKAWVKRGRRSIQESSSITRFEDTLSRGKTYRMDVRRSQDASTDNVTLTRYSSGTSTFAL